MAQKQASHRPAFANVEAFLDEVRGQATKSAEAHTEPGSIGGATTHPVKNVDDNTETAREGARSSENSKDVKEDQGKPSVDSTPEKKADGPGAEDHLQLGTTVAATGEDPKNETGKAKPGKDDPGSSHPARTDNDSLDGFKYAADLETAPLEKLAGFIQDLGNSICADLATQGVDKAAGDAGNAAGSVNHGPTGLGTPGKPTPQGGGQSKAAQVDPALAQQVGWEMAGIMTGTLDKQAAEAMVVNTISDIIKSAEDDADRVAAFLSKFQQHKQANARAKQAGEDAPPPSHEEGGGGGGGGGGADEAALAAALGGEGGGGGGGGGMPGGGGGGDPAAAGGAGGTGSDMLDQVLGQLGITADQLAQAIMAEEGQGGGAPGGAPAGGGGGMPGGGAPAGGGMPGGDPAAAAAAGPGGGGAGPQPGAGGLEVAAGDRNAPSKEKVADYVREVITRSRAKAAAAASK